MAEDTLSSDFYWDNVVFKVEDQLFCVPRFEFVRLSEVFADMFCLPSGPTRQREGQDREHPIVLEGYKKDEFNSLLRVMYPTAGFLISDTKLDLGLTKEEWVSVLKLSVIWNMPKIRDYAIHRLSTDMVLSPVEKIIIARAHKFAAWLHEGVTSLVESNDETPTLKELAPLGWETAAQILWIRNYLSGPKTDPGTLSFKANAVKCLSCSSSSSLIGSSCYCANCGTLVGPEDELTCDSPCRMGSTTDYAVTLEEIVCQRCQGKPFQSGLDCSLCGQNWGSIQVKVTKKTSEEMVEDIFGEEIQSYVPRTLDTVAEPN